ncbi:uncharacterized protein LOC128745838 [Sabethes cyaneus]|uniref:uncharacterized protein LOC128745838 n=1 Tax=Sabethes cyaneus TaxID=53552 RepID=UPI00237E4DC3|nr:uncharacterized protein LOC128745838 [Sabethes cyaneus]
MRELSTDLGVDDNLLRMLFVKRLPPKIQPILACHEGTIEKLAEMADTITDCSNGQLSAAEIVRDEQVSSNNSKLVEQIDLLTAEIRRLKAPGPTRSRSFSRNRNVSRSPSRPGICWYHRNYGNDARQCREPCSWNSKN